MSSKIVPVDGGSLYCEDKGSGKPLVFIHAGYLDSRMWDNIFDLHASNFRAIRYDVRGYGRSSTPVNAYSDEKDLLELLGFLEIDKAVLIGVSNGGRIALDFAVGHPDRIEAMVLIDSGIKGYQSSGPEEDSLWSALEAFESKYNRLVAEGKFREAAMIDVNTWSSALSGEAREKTISIAEANVHSADNEPTRLQVSPEPPSFARLNMLNMPVLVIIGSKDLPGMILLSKTVQKLLKNSALEMIEGADHVPSLSRPDEFNRILRKFLTNLN